MYADGVLGGSLTLLIFLGLALFFFSLIIEETLIKNKFLHFSMIFLSFTYLYNQTSKESLITLNNIFTINEIQINLETITFLFWGPTFSSSFSFLILLSFFILLFGGFSTNFLFKTNRNFEFSWLALIFFLSSFLLIISFDFIEIFLCLECISLCSYILISFERLNKLSATSGIQYLILSSIPSALLILGIIYLYQNYGNIITNNIELFLTNSIEEIKNYSLKIIIPKEKTLFTPVENILDHIQFYYQINFLNIKFLFFQKITFNTLNILNNMSYIHSYIFLSTGLAVLLILINLLFKLTAAPFHIWAPVIYNNGALTSVIFLAIFSKLSILLFMINLFSTTFFLLKTEWSFLLLIISIFSIFLGMLGAFNEKLVKRFFVYSSMTDVGFMLLGLSFFATNLHKYVINYLILYNLSAMIIWFSLLYFQKKTRFLTNLQTILVHNTVLNLIFSLNIFSLAGIPPFGGFFIKLDLLISLTLSLNIFITWLILLMTVINFFYYLRLIKIIYFEKQHTNLIINKIESIHICIFAFLINIICGFELYIQNAFLFIFERLINGSI